MSKVDYNISKELDNLSGKTAMEMMEEYTLRIADILREVLPEERGFRIIHVFDEEGNSHTRFDVIKKEFSSEIMKEIEKGENC